MARASMLLVEDDAALAELLIYHFKREDFDVAHTPDGEEALLLAKEKTPDIVLLDWMVEGLSGIEVCRRLRRMTETQNVPIIMLTARGEEEDRIRGLETGADDYVTKPFSPRELATRVKVVLRRLTAGGARQHAPESGSYAFAGWVLKTGERSLVDREGVSVPLSTGEYNLLLALVTRPRQVLTRDQLLDLTQGREAAAFDRAIDNQVSRLRRKIEADAKTPDIIKTVWGGGYTLAAEVTRL